MELQSATGIIHNHYALGIVQKLLNIKLPSMLSHYTEAFHNTASNIINLHVANLHIRLLLHMLLPHAITGTQTNSKFKSLPQK